MILSVLRSHLIGVCNEYPDTLNRDVPVWPSPEEAYFHLSYAFVLAKHAYYQLVKIKDENLQVVYECDALVKWIGLARREHLYPEVLKDSQSLDPDRSDVYLDLRPVIDESPNVKHAVKEYCVNLSIQLAQIDNLASLMVKNPSQYNPCEDERVLNLTKDGIETLKEVLVFHMIQYLVIEYPVIENKIKTQQREQKLHLEKDSDIVDLSVGSKMNKSTSIFDQQRSKAITMNGGEYSTIQLLSDSENDSESESDHEQNDNNDDDKLSAAKRREIMKSEKKIEKIKAKISKVDAAVMKQDIMLTVMMDMLRFDIELKRVETHSIGEKHLLKNPDQRGKAKGMIASSICLLGQVDPDSPAYFRKRIHWVNEPTHVERYLNDIVSARMETLGDKLAKYDGASFFMTHYHVERGTTLSPQW